MRRLHRDGHVPKVRIAASRLTLQRPAFIESADPLNEGSRATPRASSITSDGGEANLPILAEQPGDDARAGTVSTQAMLAALRDADHTAKERENARLKIQ